MRIFELLNQTQEQPDQQDDEDDQGKFDADKVDKHLQDISQQVDTQQAQPIQPGQEQQVPSELDDENSKPIDSALMSQIKSLPYVKNYDFDDKSPLNPIKISAMKIEDLNGLLSKVRYKMQSLMLHDQVDMDDNEDMSFCNDLMRFVNTVLHFKKSNTSAQLGSSPPYQTQN